MTRPRKHKHPDGCECDGCRTARLLALARLVGATPVGATFAIRTTAMQDEPKVTTCATCHRAVLVAHRNAEGDCVLCEKAKLAGLDPVAPGPVLEGGVSLTRINAWGKPHGRAPVPCTHCGTPTTAKGGLCSRPTCLEERRQAKLHGGRRADVGAVWQTKEGVRLRVREMPRSHLLNVLRVAARTGALGRGRVDQVLLEAHWRGLFHPERPLLGAHDQREGTPWTAEDAVVVRHRLEVLGYAGPDALLAGVCRFTRERPPAPAPLTYEELAADDPAPPAKRARRRIRLEE